MSRRVNQFRIIVNQTGSGMGAVTAKPLGPDYRAGTTVTLTAVTDPARSTSPRTSPLYQQRSQSWRAGAERALDNRST